ncbi:CbrC family protein [Bacillus xiamenensis]|uniref:CbrC family protein n=1 Tax=Bacillus xiamenensis TaxID=1178537 RepID=UPI003B8A97D6
MTRTNHSRIFSSGGNVTKGNLKQWLVNGGDLQGYLFQCVHCKKHRLHIDAS